MSIIEFSKYGRRAQAIARKKRLDLAMKQSAPNFETSSEVQRAKEFREQQKLQDLAKFDFLNQDQWSEAEFSENIEQAEKEISAKLGKGWNEEKETKNSEGLEFTGEILNTNDKLIEFGGENADFELSETDRKGMKNLLSMLKKGKNIKKLMPLKVKMINLSAN